MSRHESEKVESWVLGALMDAEGPAVRSCASELLASSGLTADEFTTKKHRAAFLAIKSLADRGRPCDAQSVFGLLRGVAGVGDGAVEALLELQSANSCNRAAFTGHAEELRRLRLLRRLEAFHSSAQSALSAVRPDPSVLGKSLGEFAAAFTSSVEPDETGDADVVRLLEEYDASSRGIRSMYCATGIGVLDRAIRGFVPNLNVIGGMPAVGKSALIAEIIMSCLERGMRVGLFGLEDATKWLPERHLARALHIPVGELGCGMGDGQREAMQDAASALTATLKNLLVFRRAGIDPATLEAKCKHWIVNLGCQCVFVDHGGEVQHQAAQRDRYDLAVASTYRAIRDVAVNCQVPIVVLCHFNRSTETDRAGVPTMQSFAETEYIARMARLALGLWQKPGDERLRCTVLKRTKGARGVTVAIERDAEYALVRRDGGELIDLDEEARSEREAGAAKRRAKAGSLWVSDSN